MQLSKKKATATAIALLMALMIAVPLTAFPAANAQVPEGMNWDLPQAPSSTRILLWERYHDTIPTWVFGVISPNPVGVGQQVSVVMFNPQQPNGASAYNDIRYQYSVTLLKPDGKTETLPSSGTFTSDSTGTSYTLFTPDQVGNYTITVKFHELYYDWQGSSTERNFYGVTFAEATYSKTLVVQEEEVLPTGWETVPLPTEYWVRPIEGTNTQWYQVASNWLSGVKDRDNGGTGNQYQQDGVAPNSGHILWTKITEDGGLVGGGNFSVPGEVFNAGHQYQTRFTNPIIMWGRLYYELPIQWSGGGGGWICVDLRTGETIWQDTTMGTGGYYGVGGVPAPAFGYYYDLDNMNNHGVVTPGWLFSSNFQHSIHPRYGIIDQLQLVNAPAPVRSAQSLMPTLIQDVIGPKGESLRYELNLNGWLAQWNSSKVFDDSETGLVPANCPITPAGGSGQYWNGSDWVSSSTISAQGYARVSSPAYDWNVTVPWATGITGGSETIRAVVYNDVLVGTNGSHPVGTSGPRYDYPESVTMWGVNLNPDKGQIGQLLYMKEIKTVTTPADGGEFMLERAAEGVAVFVKLPQRYWVGYDMHTGEKLWETDPPESEFNPFGYYSFPSLIHVQSITIAEGKLFTGGYTGAVHCYDLETGELLWRYEAPTGRSIFPYFTLMLGPVADGKIFVGTHEHSADTPLFKGNKVRALNITTGEEVWTMYGWAHPDTFAIADGTLIYWNNYDHQVYAVGKGPTALTVDAPKAAIAEGSSLMITGTVTDVSAGTTQHEQALRFPNGVPAVSDESQSAWMEYVYMQKAKPANATGVEVTLSVLDSNNNFRDIGTATSDASGFFSYQWTPDIPGAYTVVARFAGSESYYGSYAEAAFAVDAAPESTPAPTPTPPSVSEQYFMPMSIGMIIAIVVVAALLVLLLLRKRP
jgi:outer membrane protein assembly factor BamB